MVEIQQSKGINPFAVGIYNIRNILPMNVPQNPHEVLSKELLAIAKSEQGQVVDYFGVTGKL